MTLGDQTDTFSTEAGPITQCLTDLFGIFSIQLPGDDGGIQISILHEDTDPVEVGQVNVVRVSVGDEDWLADEVETVSGTFEATCGEERLS